MMEVDGVEIWNNNPSDGAKFANLKAFVNAAREFEATHSESAINMMTRYLGVSIYSLIYCAITIYSIGSFVTDLMYIFSLHKTCLNKTHIDFYYVSINIYVYF